MAEQGKYVKKGLRGKMFRLSIALVLTASVTFGIIGILQLQSMVRLAFEMSNSQTNAVKDISQSSITEKTREHMVNTVVLSARNSDNKFRTMKHAFILLADQVQDVFEHPEKYGEREVSEPDSANKGKYVLQVIFADRNTRKNKKEMSMVKKLANLEPAMREIVQDSEGNTGECFICLPGAITLAMDAKSQNKFEENGELSPYDPTIRPWYTSVVETQGFYFTLAVHSYYLSIPEVEYAVPVYVDGELKAVLQGATELEVIQDFISDVGVGENGFSIMVSDEGQLVYSPRKSGELAMVNDMSFDIRSSVNDTLLALIDESKDSPSGFSEVVIDGDPYYAAYASMPTVGWSQFTFVPKEEIQAHTDKILTEMDMIGTKAEERFRANQRKSSMVILVVVVIMIANAVQATLAMSGKILNPINKMTGQVEEMTGDQFLFEMDDVYRTGDEIEVLASTFGMLSEQMQDYLKNILSMTAEKERVGTELSIATKIQADMLPDASAAFPDETRFKLFASMDPAKEVSGDFYDFFMIDDDHLCLVIADVSDKGVPAALFMMSSMIIINNRAKQGGTPGEILTDANAQIWKNNRSKMFVTVWLGILDLSTGDMICTNAGHEYPFVRGEGGAFRVFYDKHGLVVGGMGTSKYKDYELHLNPGDVVFVYTDGVTEASNSEGEFYGMERLEAVLNRVTECDPADILPRVREDVDAFAAGARQFDDLTMLCVKYRG